MAVEDVLAILQSGGAPSNSSALSLIMGSQQQPGAPTPSTGGGLSAPSVISPGALPRQRSFSERFLEAFKTGTDISFNAARISNANARLDHDIQKGKEELRLKKLSHLLKESEAAETARSNKADEELKRQAEEGRNVRFGTEQENIQLRHADDIEIDRANLDVNRSRAGSAATSAEAAMLRARNRTPIAIRDPVTGKAVYVRPDEALGQEKPPGNPMFQTEFDKAEDRVAIELEKNIMDTADTSLSRDSEAKQLKELLSDGYTGVGGEAVLSFQKAASALGIDIGDVSTIGRREAGMALANQMALRLRDPSSGAGLPGQMSDQDRRFLVGMVAGIGTTKAGRELMVDAIIAQGKRAREIADMAVEYKSKHGRLDAKFRKQVRDFREKNHVFTKEWFKRQQKAAAEAGEGNPLSGESKSGVNLNRLLDAIDKTE